MSQEDNNFMQCFTTGVLAGTLEVTINHPLWVLKARIQSGQEPRWALKGAYRGLIGNIGSMVPLIALRLSLGTTFQHYFYDQNNNSDKARILSGLAGGSITSLIGSPIEFMRIKQLNSNTNLFSTTQTYIQQNNVNSLFKGLCATAIRDSLYTCGFFALSPIFKEKLNNYYPPYAGILTYFPHKLN